MKNTYLILAIVGFVLPYYELIQFLIENGLDIPLLIQQLFANHISSFFGLDVIVSAIALVAFIIYENRKLKIPFASIAILGTITVGVSFGLPLFLYLRERKQSTQQLY
ncbi:MAG: DUF2834 domain-containing protein [Okeania sp. SIO3C4]|nr:DUF2834 domain-containing protein [Okeania sp. SIO3C4]